MLFDHFCLWSRRLAEQPCASPPSYCAAAGVGPEAESTLGILEGLLPGAELQMVNQVLLLAVAAPTLRTQEGVLTWVK